MNPWLAATRQLDLDHPGLRITALKLTQSRQSLPARAVAVRDFVRRLPYDTAAPARHARASEVLARGRGDGIAKGVLFTAMCRAAGLPARLLFVRVRARSLAGMLPWRPRATTHAIGQVYYEGRWHSTDSYVLDPVLFAHAKQRLNESGLDSGFGLVHEASGAWDGQSPCLQQFRATDVMASYGAFHDADDFERRVGRGEPVFGDSLLQRCVQPWLARVLNRRVQRLRATGAC
jgi:hypothetical protein